MTFAMITQQHGGNIQHGLKVDRHILLQDTGIMFREGWRKLVFRDTAQIARQSEN